ncbi:MAG: DUF1858 domain-containing protein [Fusobacteria bacterium]|nr:DUF1858 domain-containing protein [Fusobacteriota bacterium]
MKKINLSDSVYKLVKENSDLKNLLAELGFKDILLPGMLDTAGRIMTIEKGAKLKKIDLEIIKEKFKEHGYQVAKEE